jgi:hypothetical protein
MNEICINNGLWYTCFFRSNYGECQSGWFKLLFVRSRFGPRWMSRFIVCAIHIELTIRIINGAFQAGLYGFDVRLGDQKFITSWFGRHVKLLAVGPRWSFVIGYGPFYLCIHKEGDINRLMMMIKLRSGSTLPRHRTRRTRARRWGHTFSRA